MTQKPQLTTAFHELELYGFYLTTTGLTVAQGQKPTFEQWEQLGAFLQWMETSLSWVIGDWLTYGEKYFAEKFAQAITMTGHKAGTIDQYRWVAERVAPANRDPDLSFSHHREVADLAPKEQRRMLKKAKRESWNVQELRAALGVEKEDEAEKSGKPLPDKTVWLLVSCKGAKDRSALLDRMQREGRSCRIP